MVPSCPTQPCSTLERPSLPRVLLDGCSGPGCGHWGPRAKPQSERAGEGSLDRASCLSCVLRAGCLQHDRSHFVSGLLPSVQGLPCALPSTPECLCSGTWCGAQQVQNSPQPFPSEHGGLKSFPKDLIWGKRMPF